MKEFARKFYQSKAWRLCRDGYFAEHNGVCEICGNPGMEVHHKIWLTPVNIDNPDITLNWDNLQLLCKDCHFAVHNKKQYLKRPVKHEARRYAFDAEGNILQNNKVVIVWGAPAAGKNQYVREHWQHGDIVVDLDRITGAITYEDSRRANVEWILPFVLDIRKYIYKLIKSKQYEINTAWVVATLPRRKEREALAQELGAELVHIDTSIQECIDRAMADDDRTDKEQQRLIILKYFERVDA